MVEWSIKDWGASNSGLLSLDLPILNGTFYSKEQLDWSAYGIAKREQPEDYTIDKPNECVARAIDTADSLEQLAKLCELENTPIQHFYLVTIEAPPSCWVVYNMGILPIYQYFNPPKDYQIARSHVLEYRHLIFLQILLINYYLLHNYGLYNDLQGFSIYPRYESNYVCSIKGRSISLDLAVHGTTLRPLVYVASPLYITPYRSQSKTRLLADFFSRPDLGLIKWADLQRSPIVQPMVGDKPLMTIGNRASDASPFAFPTTESADIESRLLQLLTEVIWKPKITT